MANVFGKTDRDTSLDSPRQPGAVSNTEYVADFVSIEQGRLAGQPDELESAWVIVDDVSLRVQDSDGRVEVIAKIMIDTADVCDPVSITVASFSNGDRACPLALSASLFNFGSREFDPIGTDEFVCGSDVYSCFRTQLTLRDSHVGHRGEIRLKLSVSPSGSHHPAGGYTIAFIAVTLRIWDPGEEDPLADVAEGASEGVVRACILQENTQED